MQQSSIGASWVLACHATTSCFAGGSCPTKRPATPTSIAQASLCSAFGLVQLHARQSEQVASAQVSRGSRQSAQVAKQVASAQVSRGSRQSEQVASAQVSRGSRQSERERAPEAELQPPASRERSKLRSKNNTPRVPFDTRRVPLFGLMRFPAPESYPVPSMVREAHHPRPSEKSHVQASPNVSL
jgi:hypothetical protein